MFIKSIKAMCLIRHKCVGLYYPTNGICKTSLVLHLKSSYGDEDYLSYLPVVSLFVSAVNMKIPTLEQESIKLLESAPSGDFRNCNSRSFLLNEICCRHLL